MRKATELLTGVAGTVLISMALMPLAASAQDAPASATTNATTTTPPTPVPPQSAYAAAPQDDEGIKDIIVTATRRSESAQKVPISITALDSKSVRTLQTSADLGALVPNVQVEQTSGFGLNRTGIRGIAQGDFNGNSTTSNMVYLDDLPMNAIYAQGVPLWDIDRAEVLRGPQGTLFGRNATGGAIRYISKAPGSTTEGYAEVSYGNSNMREFRAAISGPITSNLGARISVLANDRDGDVYNITLNRKENAEDYYGGRLVLDWNSGPVKASLKAQYFKSVVGTVGWKSTPGLSDNNALGVDQNGFTSIGDVQASYGYRNLGPASNYTIIETDGDNKEHLRHIPVSLTVDVDAGFATLTSVSGFLDVKMVGEYDSDSSPAPIVDVLEQFKDRQLTQELRLASNGDGPFKWIIGGFYMSEKLDDLLSADGTARFTNISSFYPNANSTLYARSMNQQLYTYAGFANATYQITPKLMLTAGARYTHERKDAQYVFRKIYEFPTTVGRTAFSYPDFQRAVETGQLGTLLRQGNPAGASGTDSFGQVTWKGALNYQLAERTMAYVLVSKGFKGGSFKPTANSIFDLVPDASLPITAIRPEKVVDYEGGVKSTFWGGKARVNGSVFYYNYTDYQTNQLKDGEQTFTNLPGARLYGAELEIELQPVKELTINGGFGIARSKITKVLDPSSPDNAALIGNKLPLQEDYNFNASIAYEIATRLGKFTPEVSAKHYGKYFIDKENSKAIGNFTLFNARLNFESENGKYYGSLWVKNLANTVRPIAIDDVGESFGSDQAYVNQRRRFGITAGARF